MHSSLKKNSSQWTCLSNWKSWIIGLSLCLTHGLYGQRDSIPDSLVYQLYRNNVVLYTDIGFNTAPFSLKYKDSLNNKQQLYYRNNSRLVIGLGFSYKWASLRISFGLPVQLKSVSEYGKSTYFDLGFEFKTKKRHFDVDYHNYRGYAIKNAGHWSDSAAETSQHLIQPFTTTSSLSVNSWRFFNKKIKMAALRGRKGAYLQNQISFYTKTTFNFFGVSNAGSIIPLAAQNKKNSKTGASTISGFDFGVLPGYLIVRKHKHWQVVGMLGLGGVIQLKNYYVDQVARGFLGLAPRADIRIFGGYNTPKYFINLETEFDNKSIRFTEMRFRQTYYAIKLVGGIRL